MGRFAVLFLLIGLAVGLYLGFNPTTHRQLVRWWDHERITQTSARPTPLVDMRGLNARVNRLLRTASTPRSEPTSKPETVPSSNQISAELQAFWNALRQIWLNFIAQFRTNKS